MKNRTAVRVWILCPARPRCDVQGQQQKRQTEEERYQQAGPPDPQERSREYHCNERRKRQHYTASRDDLLRVSPWALDADPERPEQHGSAEHDNDEPASGFGTGTERSRWRKTA